MTKKDGGLKFLFAQRDKETAHQIAKYNDHVKTADVLQLL